MVTQGWMYDAIVYIYALSLLFYFSDFAGRNPRIKQVGTGLLSFVWVLQTLLFARRLFQDPGAAMLSGFDSLLLFSWLTVTVSLAFNLWLKMDALVFFVNVVGFALASLNFFSDESVSPTLTRWNVQDELLFVHVSLAIAGYASFLIAAVFSGTYLFLHRQLKNKRWTQTMQRVPSLEKLEKGAYAGVVVGTPLLILSLALGVVWIILNGDRKLFVDPKVLNSILIIAAYGFFLTQRVTGRAAGTKLAGWNLGAFALVVANIVVSNLLSHFHQWMWR